MNQIGSLLAVLCFSIFFGWLYSEFTRIFISHRCILLTIHWSQWNWFPSSFFLNHRRSVFFLTLGVIQIGSPQDGFNMFQLLIVLIVTPPFASTCPIVFLRWQQATAKKEACFFPQKVLKACDAQFLFLQCWNCCFCLKPWNHRALVGLDPKRSVWMITTAPRRHDGKRCWQRVFGAHRTNNNVTITLHDA